MSLVSIVTPTVPGREALLLERCMPSVRAQTWPLVEHVIVSDRNPGLVEKAAGLASVRFVELNETWRDGYNELSTGAIPWQIGSLLAMGEFVGFLGDDDELLPDHVERHMAGLEQSGADFTIGPVQFVVRGATIGVIGDDTFAHGHLDSDGIFCRVGALRTATWRPAGNNAADAQLVLDWLSAGLRGHFIGGAPTAIHHDGWAA
ncbi:MAG: glycosyltransferase family 2 protein [Gammaproteobacteria bacterium]